MYWYVATDLEYHFVFPTEIALTTKHQDNFLWSGKLTKKGFVIELAAPFEENFDWAHKKYSRYISNCISVDMVIPQSDVNPTKSGSIVSYCWGVLG